MMECKLLSNGAIEVKQYKITNHAIQRYRERVCDDISKLISDISCAGLFTEKKKSNNIVKSLIRRSKNKGCHIIRNKDALFIVKSDSNEVLTTITMSLLFSCMGNK